MNTDNWRIEPQDADGVSDPETPAIWDSNLGRWIEESDENGFEINEICERCGHVKDHEMELEPGPPNREDACMVCDRIDCVCPPEDEPTDASLDPFIRSVIFKTFQDSLK